MHVLKLAKPLRLLPALLLLMFAPSLVSAQTAPAPAPPKPPKPPLVTPETSPPNEEAARPPQTEAERDPLPQVPATPDEEEEEDEHAMPGEGCPFLGNKLELYV